MTRQRAAPGGGRVVAWAGFGFGSAMSVAGNFLHAWLPAADHDPEWMPSIATQVGAAVWPVALLISVEVLSRVQWPDSWTWNLARYGGAGTVAVGSGIISYGHLHDVLMAWGYGELGAGVGPLVLDGLMVVSGFALLAQTGTDQPDQEGQTGRTGTPDNAPRVQATAERTTPDRPDRTAPEPTVRPALTAVSDHPDLPGPERGPNRPEPVVDLREPRRTAAGPDPLLDEAVQWSAALDRTPSQRAVRERFGVGHARAVRLLDQLQEARS